LARLAQRGKKTLAIFLVPKDVFPAVPAIDHVVDRPGVFHAQFAGHGSSPLCPLPAVNEKSANSEGDTRSRSQSLECA